MYQVPIFKGEGREFKMGKMKKKITKINPTNLVSGTLEKLRKLHNKEYIYIYTQLIYVCIYDYIYTAEPYERMRKALEVESEGKWDDSFLFSLPCTTLG